MLLFMKKDKTPLFLSENPVDRYADLFSVVNISQFSSDYEVSRKVLYSMRDKGFMPRNLLIEMCNLAEINPVKVEFSPEERLYFLQKMLDEFKEDSAIVELDKQITINPTPEIKLIKQLYIEKEIPITSVITYLYNLNF